MRALVNVKQHVIQECS